MVSQVLIDRVKRHEGLLLTARPDAKGMYVVGYGHDVTEDQAERLGAITLDVAQTWLQEDLEHAEYAAQKSFGWMESLDINRQDVLTEMVFQLGMGGVLTFKKFLMCLSGGDYAGAAAQMVMSEWHNQTPERCEELAAIVRTGVTDE